MRSYVPCLFVGLIATMGCRVPGQPNTRVEELLPQAKDGNLVLYLSNQSFAINPVDITVHIDGKKAIEGEFDVTGDRIPQHNWVRHVFRLAPGKHTLRVVSSKGDATLAREFEIKHRLWIAVDYSYYPEVTGGAGPTPKSFGFYMQDTPIGFK